MSEPADWRNELHELCEAVIEDRLTPEQAKRLEHLVLETAEARRYYVECLHQHASLQWSAAEPAFLPAAAPERKPQENLRSRFSLRKRPLLAAGLLAASVLLAVALWSGLGAWGQSGPHYATLLSGKGCKWDAGTLPTEDGARLSAGRLRLAEGLAHIRFAKGAEVTLEAPAELEIVSAQRCVLHGGRLVANVPPPAIGFVVDTPTAVLKDLGTEFGVHVRDAQTADVQVFNGIVDVKHRVSGRTERLLTGKSRRFGTDKSVDFDPLTEEPPGAAPRPDVEGARVVQVSTATGRGRDAYVQPTIRPINRSDILLLVKNTVDPNSDYNRKAYIGMDLAPIAGLKVIDAQLSLTFTPTGMGFASQVPDATFAVYGLTEKTLNDWDAGALRWQNAPANAPGGAGVDAAKVIRLGTFEIAQGALQGTRSISSPALVDFLNRDAIGLVTFIVVRETAGTGRQDLVHGFAGRNHPTLPPPTLKLTAVPR
jgi:ferric-dicitrate binding protein FerR (iron transport regulator)